MWSRIKSASVGRKLAALCTLAITVFFVLAVIGTMQFNAISAAAKNIVADKQYKAVVDDAQAQWLTDDDAMNMYAALTSLRDPAQASLAQTQWQTVTSAYTKATADLTQARTQAQSAHEAAIIDGLQRDLPTYQKFSDAMKAQTANGNLRGAVHSVTIDNAVISQSLQDRFAQLSTLVNHSFDNDEAAIAAATNNGRSLLIVLALVGGGLIGLIGWLTTRSVTRSLRRANQTASRWWGSRPTSAPICWSSNASVSDPAWQWCPTPPAPPPCVPNWQRAAWPPKSASGPLRSANWPRPAMSTA